MTRRRYDQGQAWTAAPPSGSDKTWASIQCGLAGRFVGWRPISWARGELWESWSWPVPVTKCHTHSGTPVAWPPKKKLEQNTQREKTNRRRRKKSWCGTELWVVAVRGLFVCCTLLFLGPAAASSYPNPRWPGADVLRVSGFPFQAVSPAAFFSLSLLPSSSPLDQHLQSLVSLFWSDSLWTWASSLSLDL